MHLVAAEQDTERRLLTPDEALRLPADDLLIFVAGYAPIYGTKIKYYNDREFARRAEISAPVAVGRQVSTIETAPIENTGTESAGSSEAVPDEPNPSARRTWRRRQKPVP